MPERPRLTWPLIFVPALLVAACATTRSPSATQTGAVPATATTVPATESASAGCVTRDPVTLQLKWLTQAQFAGYYAADGQGYFDAACLDVTILPGGPDIVPEQVVDSGVAEFGITFLPSLLAAREQGLALVNIAQVFERSATRQISWQDSGITSPADLKGTRSSVWFGGNENELLATLAKAGLNKDTDLELVAQGSDMSLLLNHQVDSSAAMTYNELAQVLETPDENGQLHSLSDLNIIDFNADGTAMLQDGIVVREDWLSEAANQDIARRFLQASFHGWLFCSDHVESCVDYVLAEGPTLRRGHQTWMLNEVNQLIWPAAHGIGQMSPAAFQRTADIAQEYGVIRHPPTAGAYVTDYAEAALSDLVGDTLGVGYVPLSVTVTAGGK
jgi:NitT/TauT family transport system substrate-binding protein